MKTNIVQCDTLQFTAHELSLKEVRIWLSSFTQGGQCDIIDELSIPGISLQDLATICRCEVSEFDALTSRELDSVASAARDLNPAFFRVRDTLASTIEKMMEVETIIGSSPQSAEVE